MFQHFTFSTRGSFGFVTPSACPMRSSPGSECLIQQFCQGSGPDQIQMAFVFGTRAPSRPPERGGPRGSVPVRLHHRDSAYFIGTRPTSSGLGPRADRPSTAAIGAFSQRGYVPVQAGVPVQSLRRAARSGPIRNCSHATVQLAYNARLVLTNMNKKMQTLCANTLANKCKLFSNNCNIFN